jgi:long-chain acyl-CoA synthetase
MSTVTAGVRLSTIAARVRDRANATPDVIALREKDLGLWQQVSWSQYWQTAELVGHALLALG